MTFTRDFPVEYINIGASAAVRVEFASAESYPITGFYYSEQFRNWIEVIPQNATLNGNPLDFDYELEDSDTVMPGHNSHRWILDDPDGTGSDLEIQAGDVLVINYAIRSFDTGVTQAYADGWFALLESPVVEAVNGWDDSSPILRFVVQTDAQPAPPAALLATAYPNPFNPSTTLRFENDLELALRLEVVDLSGRRLRLLADERFAAGAHELMWDGRDDQGRVLPSGLYLARLAGEGIAVRTTKLMLLK